MGVCKISLPKVADETIEQSIYGKENTYGLTDYLRIVTEDYYYVDKTRYIEDLEKTAAFLFLIRPRRFGKSFVPEYALLLL